MAEKKVLVDIFGLSRYHDNLQVILAKAAGDAEQNAKDYADGLAGNYDAAGSAAAAQAAAEATAAADATSKADAALAAAKEYADELVKDEDGNVLFDAAGSAAAAETTAKGYADSLVKDADGNSRFDAAGAAAAAQAAAAADATSKADAAQSAAEATAAADATSKADAALAAAKEYADGLNTAMDTRVDVLEGRDVYVATDVTSAINSAKQNAKAHADALNTAMDTRVKVLEAIDHDKLAADASAAAVATVLDGAPEKFDTLKEVAQWISDSETAASAADLVTRVAALEAADTTIRGEFAAADAQVLADAKSYADSLVKDSEGNSRFDAAGSAAAAQAAAEATADADATSKANAALDAAKTYVDEQIALFTFATDGDIDKLFANNL